MDAQVKGYLEAHGARLLHLAGTDPQSYVETRMQTEEWWQQWRTDHASQIRAVEDHVALSFVRLMHDEYARRLREDPTFRDGPVPREMAAMCPSAKTAGEAMDFLVNWVDELGMQILADHEGSDR